MAKCGFAGGVAKFGNILMIGLLWLLCSIPVVTVGASTAAMYRAIFALRDGDGSVTGVFFRGFRTCFRQATVIWLIMAAAGGVLFLLPGVAIRSGSQMVMIATGVIVVAAVFVWLPMLSCVFPLTAYFETSVKKTLRNALFICVKYRKRAALPAILIALPVAPFFIDATLFFILLPVFLLLCPGFFGWIVSGKYLPIFRKYEEKRKEAEEQET